jgi:DNA-binding NtrC family response regulator
MINMVHNAVTKNCTEKLTLEDFPGLTPGTKRSREIVRKIGSNQFALHGIFHDFPTIDEVEGMMVEEAITLSHGNRSIAARMLGVSRPTLQKKLVRFADKYSEDDGE